MSEVLSIAGSVASLLAFAGSVIVWLRARSAASRAASARRAAEAARDAVLQVVESLDTLRLFDEGVATARLAWEGCRDRTVGGYDDAAAACARLAELVAGLEQAASNVVSPVEWMRLGDDLRRLAALLDLARQNRERFEAGALAEFDGRTPKEEALRRLHELRTAFAANAARARQRVTARAASAAGRERGGVS